jgi:uncharacterized protein YabN with tetrapyrrole methylase and pyrophosphatase domain
MRAQKVGKKASFFDFGTTEEVIAKLYEEIDEVKEAYADGDASHIEEEIGDLLLTVTSLCRKVHVDAEEAMNKATNKFIDRFEEVENKTIEEGKNIEEMSMVELDAIWDALKAAKREKSL